MEHRCRCKLRASWLAVSPAFLNFVMISSFKAVTAQAVVLSVLQIVPRFPGDAWACVHKFFLIFHISWLCFFIFQMITFLGGQTWMIDSYVSPHNYPKQLVPTPQIWAKIASIPPQIRKPSGNLTASDGQRYHTILFCFVGLQGTTSPPNANS